MNNYKKLKQQVSRPSEAQLCLINFINAVLDLDFKPKSMKDASNFIDKNINEANVAYRERKIIAEEQAWDSMCYND